MLLKNKLVKISVLISLLFICACSTKKYKPVPWCEDLFIPGNEYYEENLRQQRGYEVPPVLQASKILPPSMLKSDFYEVEENVYSDGIIDHFRVKSRWGTSTAAGFVVLKTRINEVNAIESLDKMEGTSFFDGIYDAGKSFVMGPWNLLKLIASPFTSSKKEPTKEEIAEQKKLEKIKEEERKHLESLDTDGDGEPDIEEDDNDITNDRFKKIVDSDKHFVQHASYENEEVADVGTIQSMLGVEKYVYEILEQFNIDPDNTNETLKEKIRTAARLKANGKLSTMLIPSVPVLTIISSTGSLVEAANKISAYQDSKEQLRQIHDGLLLAGCSERLIRRFEENDGMSTFVKTLIANNVIKLRKVKNANEIIKLAILVDDYETSWILMQGVDILPALYDEIKFQSFVKESPLPTVITSDNKSYIVLAGDHMYWTKENAMLIEETLEAIKESGIRPTQINLKYKGILSERMKKELEKLGVKESPVNKMVYSIDLYNEKK